VCQSRMCTHLAGVMRCNYQVYLLNLMRQPLERHVSSKPHEPLCFAFPVRSMSTSIITWPRFTRLLRWVRKAASPTGPQRRHT
jgi:hypothetical protein